MRIKKRRSLVLFFNDLSHIESLHKSEPTINLCMQKWGHTMLIDPKLEKLRVNQLPWPRASAVYGYNEVISNKMVLLLLHNHRGIKPQIDKKAVSLQGSYNATCCLLIYFTGVSFMSLMNSIGLLVNHHEKASNLTDAHFSTPGLNSDIINVLGNPIFLIDSKISKLGNYQGRFWAFLTVYVQNLSICLCIAPFPRYCWFVAPKSTSFHALHYSTWNFGMIHIGIFVIWHRRPYGNCSCKYFTKFKTMIRVLLHFYMTVKWPLANSIVRSTNLAPFTH